MYPKPSRVILCVALAGALAGCATDFHLGKPRVVPPEYRQKVGLFVHDKPERFFYPGTANLDISDLMSFHLQQTLPFTSESAFREIFSDVEVKEPGPKIQFKAEDLAGYFEIKIASARYDYPDAAATKFRADVELLVEFKTMGGEVIWNGIFQGEGIGFSDSNIRLTRFGRESATALEDAFQNAIYDMQDAVLESMTLRNYFRWRFENQNRQQPTPPASQP